VAPIFLDGENLQAVFSEVQIPQALAHNLGGPMHFNSSHAIAFLVGKEVLVGT
jgi:hypothetical protein